MELLQNVKNAVRYLYYRLNRHKYGNLDKSSRIAFNIKVSVKKNLYLNENTNIDAGAIIMNGRARFIMKKNSGSAIGLLAITGNHISLPGVWFKQVTDSVKDRIDTNHEADQDIVVEEDVWIGAHVTLLKGVTLGRGCEIGSGAVIRKDVPPYACVVGNPGKVVGFKFTPEEIAEHERTLYPENERLPMSLIEKNYEKYYLRRIKEIKEYLK